MIDEIRNIKSGKKELREFGLTIGAILVILGLVAVWRGKNFYPYLLAVGISLIASGLISPGILKIPQKIWMAFAVVIGFFMSRLILSILFYAVITPIGFALRIFGKDILDMRIDRNAATYWKKHEPEMKTRESYENQY